MAWQHGSDCKSWLERKGGRIAWERQGRAFSEALLVGVTLQVSVMFLCFRMHLRTDLHLPMLHMKKFQEQWSLARNGRLWEGCPNTFSKEILINILQWGPFFRCTSYAILSCDTFYCLGLIARWLQRDLCTNICIPISISLLAIAVRVVCVLCKEAKNED